MTQTILNWEPLITILRTAANIATTEHHLLFSPSRASTDYKADGTPVSRVDIAVNDLLRNFAHEHHLGYVGEEGNGALDQEYVLYVDSIDGTTAFLRGMNTATIIVSLMHVRKGWGTPLKGAIIEPLSGRIWISEKNGPTRYIDGPSAPSTQTLTLTGLTPPRIKTNVCVFPGASHQLSEISQHIIADNRFDDQQMGAFGISGGLIASELIHAAAIARTAAVEAAAMLLIVRGAGGVARDLQGDLLSTFKFGEVRGKPDFELPNGALFASSPDVADIFQEKISFVHNQ